MDGGRNGMRKSRSRGLHEQGGRGGLLAAVGERRRSIEVRVIEKVRVN